MFEDLEVGQRSRVGPQLAGAAAGVHPVHSAALAAELWRSSDTETDALEEHVGLSWSAVRALSPEDVLSLETTVVRLVPERSGLRGRVSWHHKLRDESGALVGSGTTVDVLQARDAFARQSNRDVGTVAWAEGLAELLRTDERFGRSVASWDGTIGLRSGDRDVHLRVYRGRIIEVTKRSPHGATFTLGAEDHAWVDILTADTDRPFGVLLMTGAFEASGDPYEYLRLTKTLEIIVEFARAYARGPARQGV